MTALAVLAAVVVVVLVILVVQSLLPALLTSKAWNSAAADKNLHALLLRSWELYLVAFGVVGAVMVAAWLLT